MWFMTQFGFFSVVQKEGESDLTVRARVRVDLEELRKRYLPGLGDIREHAGTDYQYRARISHSDLAEAMKLIVHDIDYPNFKNEVLAKQGVARAQLYAQVWGVLWNLADA
jgi:hypothetical protein